MWMSILIKDNSISLVSFTIMSTPVRHISIHLMIRNKLSLTKIINGKTFMQLLWITLKKQEALMILKMTPYPVK